MMSFLGLVAIEGEVKVVRHEFNWLVHNEAVTQGILQTKICADFLRTERHFPISSSGREFNPAFECYFPWVCSAHTLRPLTVLNAKLLLQRPNENNWQDLKISILWTSAKIHKTFLSPFLRNGGVLWKVWQKPCSSSWRTVTSSRSTIWTKKGRQFSSTKLRSPFKEVKSTLKTLPQNIHKAQWRCWDRSHDKYDSVPGRTEIPSAGMPIRTDRTGALCAPVTKT